MDEPTVLEGRWDFEIAEAEARAAADELLAIVNTAMEETVLGIGRVLWTRACEERDERAGDAPLVEAIARVEPKLSRSSMYRAIAAYRQSLVLPADVRGRLGPSRIYQLLRLPDDHLEKVALARRAARSEMSVEALRDEVDGLLGVERPDKPAPFGRAVLSTERMVERLVASAPRWKPHSNAEREDRIARVEAMRQALAGLVKELRAARVKP